MAINSSWTLRYTPRVCRASFFFQAEDGIRDYKVTGVQTCALPILRRKIASSAHFHAPAFQVSSLVGDNGTDSVRIGLFPSEMNSQPVIVPAGIVTEKEDRKSVV